MTSQPGVRVYLPESVTSKPHELGQTVTITVNDKNALFWEKDSVTFDQFLIRLVRFKAECDNKKQEAHVLFNADQRADHGPCVTILDEIRKAGIEKVSIETRVKKS